ncbi:MAG: MFS transporter [Bacteroidia bacterium]|nr:MFS transporter [Bacteroidia bacterium]
MQNKQSLYLLFTANAISGFAQGISMLAIPWYFTQLGKSSWFSLAYGFITLFVMVFGLYAGTLVDRFSRKKNFLYTSLVCGLLIGSIAAYGYFTDLPDWMVIAVFAITMLNYNIHYPTLYAFGHEISTPENYGKINSQIEITGQSTSVLSGAFSGILLEGIQQGPGHLFGMDIHFPVGFKAWEIQEVFALDASTYLISVVLIGLINYTPVKKVTVETGSLLSRIKSGFSYLKHHPRQLWFGLFSFSVFAALIVSIHALIPVYVDKRLGESASVFAATDLIYAMGALLAGFLAVRLLQYFSSQKAVLLLTVLGALLYFSLFLGKSILLLYLFGFLMGISNAGIRVLRLTYLFEKIPNELMGRVNSIFNMANVFTRSAFIFLFSLPFFTFDENIIYAFLVLAIFLGFSGLVLYLNSEKQEDELSA